MILLLKLLPDAFCATFPHEFKFILKFLRLKDVESDHTLADI